MKDNLLLGPQFFLQGFRWIFAPGIRQYILVPIVVNILLMVGIVIGIAFFLNTYLSAFLASYPAWLMLLIGGAVWILYGLLSWLVGTLLFVILTNIIASPFYGLMSEAVEEKIEGKLHRPNSMKIWSIWYHTFWREIRKLGYFIPWLLLCLFLLPFPILWPFFPLVWWGVMAWIMSVQYCDYAADNQQIPLKDLIETLHSIPMTALGFGAAVSLALAIPGLNLIAPAAAVAGGTALFLTMHPKHKAHQHKTVIKK